MAAFEILPGDPGSTVILQVPHSSTSIPAPVRAGIVLDDEALAFELAAITDADTDLIAEGAAEAASARLWIFVNRASRLVIDPERFPDEREELNAVGCGLRTHDDRCSAPNAHPGAAAAGAGRQFLHAVLRGDRRVGQRPPACGQVPLRFGLLLPPLQGTHPPYSPKLSPPIDNLSHGRRTGAG